MPKRYSDIIYKQFLKNKKTIKVILSNTTKIRLIRYIENPKEAFNINYIYIKNTEVEEIIRADIITTSHPIRSDTTSIINLNIS